jgi:hypothetical protein
MRKRTRVKNWLTALSLILALTIDSQADNNLNKTAIADQSAKDYISSIYEKINFCREGKLNPLVFETAYRGYANLKTAGKLAEDKQIISIADYSLSANTKRLWIIDLKTNKVLLNTYVAHGQGTGEEFATAFSDRENSHQSSLGFYITGETYIGEHGLSLYLHGMDNGYNANAYRRSVVLHGAAYVSEAFIQANKRLGRSWGCPAVAQELASEIISTVKNGTCLFIYHPDKRYFAQSCWLNKKSNRLQDEMQQKQFELAIPQQPEGNEQGLVQTL